MAQYASTQPTGYKNHLQNIAIVGAGGRAGKYIVTSLLSNGVSQKITALTRADSSTTFAPGVQTAHIDYTHPSTIVSALRGQDVLIITMSVMAAPDSSKKLIEAAAEAGVKWVLPNEWGFDASNEEAGKDSMIYEAKKADRELIESLGVSSWIGIACGFWYEFSLGGGDIRYGFDFSKKTIVFYNDGNTKIHTSTWAACGNAVSELLALPILPQDENDTRPTISTWKNDFVRVGSFEISQKDMFASVLRVTGDKESDWTISYQSVVERFEQGRAEMQKGNMMGFGQLLYARAFYPDGAGNFGGYAGLDDEKLGLEREDLDEATKFGIHLHESGHFEEERARFMAGRAAKKY